MMWASGIHYVFTALHNTTLPKGQALAFTGKWKFQNWMKNSFTTMNTVWAEHCTQGVIKILEAQGSIVKASTLPCSMCEDRVVNWVPWNREPFCVATGHLTAAPAWVRRTIHTHKVGWMWYCRYGLGAFYAFKCRSCLLMVPRSG